MRSTKLSPESTERFSLNELLSIDSVNLTRLLVFVFEIYIVGLLIILFLSLIGMTLELLVLKYFLVNRSKINSIELLMIGIVLA